MMMAAANADEAAAAAAAAAAAEEEEFRLPITHVIENSLDTDGLEIASQDKHISSSNVGFQMLMRMGWQQGKPLGRSGTGIVEPIKTEMRDIRMGLGKPEEDEYWISAENIKRKPMETELEETEALREKRDAQATKESKLKAELSHIKKTYYCDVCDKTYNSGGELEVHLSSYEHGHRKRFRDMKMMQNRNSKASNASRERKEAERQRREMEKYAEMCKKAEAKPIAPARPTPPSNSPAPKQAAFGQVKLFGSKAVQAKGGAKPKGKLPTKATLSVFNADDDD